MAWPSSLARTKNWGTEILTDSDLEGQFDLIIDYINDMMNSASGHKHDATTAEGPKILVSDLSLTSGAAGDVLYHNGTNLVRLAKGTALQLLRQNSGLTAPEWASYSTYVTAANALSGSVIQVVKTINTTASTISTAMPIDDTIPQNTEGGSCGLDTAITPNNSSNRLIITVVVNASAAAGQNTTCGLALFQDTTANALSASFNTITNNATANQWVLTHEMAAGTTSETTFKARLGTAAGDTITLNGQSGSRIFGGVLNCVMTVTEIKA